MKIIAALSICLMSMRRFSENGIMAVCEAKAGQDEEAVEEFIRGYYAAFSKGNLDILKNYIIEEEYLKKTMFSMQAFYECGFTKYDHIDIFLRPLSDGRHWVAFVNYDMVVEDLDVPLPGAIAHLVEKSKDGIVLVAGENYDNLSQDLLAEVREIALSDEVCDRTMEQDAKYNEIIAEYPDVMEWITSASDAKTRAMEKYYQEINGEKSDSMKGNRYLVKQGDCLWNIAQNELGDSMYWSEIYEANKAVIGENPDLLYVGIELTLDYDKE